MNGNSKNYIFYGAMAISLLITAVTAVKYIYLFNIAEPGRLLQNAGETEREFFYHFYDWLTEKRPAFLMHIIFGSIALLAGPFQLIFKPGFKPGMHTATGVIYAIAVFFASSGGIVIARESFGGNAAKAGFSGASYLWMITLAVSLLFLIRKNYRKHGAWMKINYSLTFAAVTLRLEQPVLLLLGLDTITSYQIVSWLCWVPNLIFAFYHVKPFGTSILNGGNSSGQDPHKPNSFSESPPNDEESVSDRNITKNHKEIAL